LNVNVWQYFTTDNVKAALNAKNQEFGGVSGKYVFVWEGCDLDLVIAELVKLPTSKWSEIYPGLAGEFDGDVELYTIEGVKKFLYEAYTNKAEVAAASAATELAKTYYEASINWQYSDNQVAALAGAAKIEIDTEIK